MTVFQLNRPQATTAPASWTQATPVVERPARHATESRARLTLRRLFYTARHAAS